MMPILLWSLFSGLVFGAGLTVSRMIDPSKVIGFLDVAGDWDPSLAVVMIGALAVTIPAFALLRKSGKAFLGVEIRMPDRNDVDLRLILGAVLFGIGRGLGGFCPGPGISALAFGLTKPLVFVGAMVVGMLGFQLLAKNNN